jgi:hypothetical protein
VEVAIMALAPSPPPVPGVLNGYLSEADTAAQIGKGIRILQRWRRTHTGPPYTNIGKTVWYRRDTLQAWLLSQERHPLIRETTGRMTGHKQVMTSAWTEAKQAPAPPEKPLASTFLALPDKQHGVLLADPEVSS